MFCRRLAAITIRVLILTISSIEVASLFEYSPIISSAFAQDSDCEVKSIKLGSATEAIEANFAHLAACIRQLQAKLDQARVPDGAVVAFDADNCPDGWEYYTPAVGRFLLGGLPPLNSRMRVALPLPKAPILSLKGSSGAVTFTPIYLPPPTPPTPQQVGNKDIFAYVNLPGLLPDAQPVTLGAFSGPDFEWKGNQRVPTFHFVPPFLSLLYCKKISVGLGANP